MYIHSFGQFLWREREEREAIYKLRIYVYRDNDVRPFGINKAIVDIRI